MSTEESKDAQNINLNSNLETVIDNPLLNVNFNFKAINNIPYINLISDDPNQTNELKLN